LLLFPYLWNASHLVCTLVNSGCFSVNASFKLLGILIPAGISEGFIESGCR